MLKLYFFVLGCFLRYCSCCSQNLQLYNFIFMPFFLYPLVYSMTKSMWTDRKETQGEKVGVMIQQITKGWNQNGKIVGMHKRPLNHQDAPNLQLYSLHFDITLIQGFMMCFMQEIPTHKQNYHHIEINLHRLQTFYKKL